MGFGDGGRRDLLQRGVRPAVGDVLAHGAVEQEHILGHEADGVPQVGQPEVAMSWPSTSMPAGDVVEPKQQLDDRGLARAGRADDGNGVPGRKVNRRWRTGTLVIGERDLIEIDPPWTSSGGALPARRQSGVGVEQVEDPIGRRHGSLVEVEGFPETGERPQQSLGQEHHDRVATDRQVPSRAR